MNEDADVLTEIVNGQLGQGRGALVRRAPSDVVLMPVMNVKLAKERLAELQAFCAEYLQESRDGGEDGGDYGIIPGTKRKTLFKSGAEKLCDVYGLADRYRIVSKVEDFDHGLFDYVLECELVRKTDEMFVGSGLGSCSSYEAKYRWRDSKRLCPACGAETIIKGKAEYGGGWLCWTKKGGCGAKFADNDAAVVGQTLARVENPDIIDQKNTVLKIAKKRAKIDAVIGVTRSSNIFTQDLDTVVEVAPSDESETHGTVGAPTNRPAESHAERIARVKAEAAAAAVKSERAETNGPRPVPTKATNESSDGRVLITAINVRNGPMVVKDGVSKPQWGPLYVIAFSQKVKADDGTWVADATSFDEKIAKAAEDARDAKTEVNPVVAAGKKKGSFNLVRFE